MIIAAGKFKSECLKLMDDVKNHHKEFIITKRGVPVAKLVPINEDAKIPLFGFLKDSVKINGDVIGPIGEKWDAESE